MTDGKFKVLALLIGVAFVTITVGIFSPAWLCETTYKAWDNFEVCGGIVPYYSVSLLIYTFFVQFSFRMNMFGLQLQVG